MATKAPKMQECADATATCTRTVSLSGIIGVSANVLVGLLSDIHTIELYGFPHVITRCLLETFRLPTDILATRRCTLDFGRYQGCMLREQLVFSGPKGEADPDTSTAREYVIQLRFLDGTDAEAERSPLGAVGRAVQLEAVTTYTITPITTSPHQCFFQLTTSLLLRDGDGEDVQRRGLSGSATLTAAHTQVRAFWAAYGEQLFVAIQRYVVSKAYSPSELGLVDPVETDAEAMMLSLEQHYTDIVAEGQAEPLSQPALLALLESFMVQLRRLLHAYRRARLQGRAERATVVRPASSADTTGASGAPAARDGYWQGTESRLADDCHALRVQAIVEMEHQRATVDQTSGDAPPAATASPWVSRDGDSAPAPPRMIDVRAPTETVSRSFSRALAMATHNNNTNNNTNNAQGDSIAPTRSSFDGSLQAKLARVSAASRAADMRPAALSELTTRGEKPVLAHPDAGRPMLTWPAPPPPTWRPATDDSSDNNRQTAMLSWSVTGLDGTPDATPTAADAKEAARVAKADAAALRQAPTVELLRSRTAAVEDGAAREVFRRFWSGHSGAPLAPQKPEEKRKRTSVAKTSLITGGSSNHGGGGGGGVQASSKLPALPNCDRATTASMGMADGELVAAAVPLGQLVPSATTTTPSAAMQYWTSEDVKNMLRALNDGGVLYTPAQIRHFASSPRRGERDYSPSAMSPPTHRASAMVSVNTTNPSEAQLPAAPSRPNPSEPPTSSNFGAYKREAQRNFVDRYSGNSADRLGSSFGGESSLANSGIAFSPSSTFNGVGGIDGRVMSGSFTNDSDLRVPALPVSKESGTNYFTQKLRRASPLATKALTPSAVAESALARVEAALLSMETPEQVARRVQADQNARRDVGAPFVPPLLRRDLPLTLQGVPANTSTITLADVTAREADVEAAAQQRREAALQQAADALVEKFAFRQRGRLYFDEAQMAMAHVVKD